MTDTRRISDLIIIYKIKTEWTNGLNMVGPETINIDNRLFILHSEITHIIRYYEKSGIDEKDELRSLLDRSITLLDTKLQYWTDIHDPKNKGHIQILSLD